MTYKISTSRRFDKSYKKLSAADRKLAKGVIETLARGERLDARFCDHQLKGKLKAFRDCHIKGDLVLIYRKDEERLVLFAVEIGSHSELF